jgi:outer membrane lipoprotein-sorting protein
MYERTVCIAPSMPNASFGLEIKKMRSIFAFALLAVLIAVSATVANKPGAKIESFDNASARFEQNATDGDVEAVFEAIGGDDGLAKLSVVAPDGRTVVDFSSLGRASMGMRQFRFESPEPTDVAALKKAFPEGEYTFTGTTPSGSQLMDKVKLSHKLPTVTRFVSPKPDARNVPVKNLKISWAPVKGVAGYTVELDPSKSSAHMELKLPASTTSIVVPEGILVPNGKCQLGIGTVSTSGNVSVIETTFTTTGK